MRQFLLGIVAAAAVCGPAAAQYGSTPYQTGYTTSTTPLGELSKAGQSWLITETMKEAMQVLSLADLDKDIEASVASELDSIGAHHHATHDDMVAAVRYTIVAKAREMMIAEVKQRQKAYDKDKSDDNMLGLQGAISRKTRLDQLYDRSRRRLSRAASQIAAD
ncbi:MAG: hypothetical protein ACM3W4_09835 [Ignavibacteriales bacterium]